jgi:hypothetical protein
MNQSQYENSQSPGEFQSQDGHQDFSPEVHMLAGMLVSIMLTDTWCFSGYEVLHEPRPHNWTL